MNMKRALLITVLLILCSSLSGCFSIVKEYAKMQAELDARFDHYRPLGCIDKDVYSEGIRDIDEYTRYYYASDISEELLDAGYKAVSDDEDRQNVISYFETVEAYLNDKSQFDFDYNVITCDDLYTYFKTTDDSYDTHLFYYDRESCTLYYLIHTT